MTELSEIERHAIKLLHHRAHAIPNPVLPEKERLDDLTLAYAIQDAADAILRDTRSYKAIGYKLAGTNPVSRAHLKIDGPFFGRLYDRMTSFSPATVIDAGFFRVHEPEIGIQIGLDLDLAEAPFNAAKVEAATRAVLPAIEIIGTPFTPWVQAGGPNLASDNAAFGYWIMGEPILDWSDIDLLDGVVTLSINGKVVATGKGRNVDGGAFGATAWLANTLAAKGRTLKAGDYVTTGSVTPPIPVEPRQQVHADFGPLGRVELRIADAL
jgi:2-keto-4-pentenoate hydratase